MYTTSILKTRLQKLELSFLLGVIFVTMAFHLTDLGLPILYGDELTLLMSTITFITNPSSDLYTFGHQFAEYIGPFPISHSPYYGGVSAYLVTPFLYFFGINPVGVRIYEMVVAISIVVLTYFAGKELFSRRIGMVSSAILATFPAFVFYSRQGLTYDLVLISFALAIIIFGMKYLKTFKLRYLFGSIVLIGLGLWGYLWFGWFIVGLIVILPFYVKKMISLTENGTTKGSDISHSVFITVKGKIKFLTISVGSLILGFVPLILVYVTNKKNSLPYFILDTITKKSSYLNTSVENTNFVSNFSSRFIDFFYVLSKPQLGLQFGVTTYGWTDQYLLFPVLFLLSLLGVLLYVVYKKPGWKITAVFSLLLLSIFISSSFTVTHFNSIQLLLYSPFFFLFMGKGLDVITSYTKFHKPFLFFNKKRIDNYLLIGIVAFVILSQIPIFIKEYKTLEDFPTSQASTVYNTLNQYLKQNNLKTVTASFAITKSFVFYTNGDQIIHRMFFSDGHPYVIINNTTILNLESANNLDPRYMYLVYVYPTVPDCKGIISPEFINTCQEINGIASIAIKNGKELQIIDFNLPDGSPYIRGFRLGN